MQGQFTCVSADCGTGYISALSKNVAPASAAWLSSRSATSGSVLSPNSMVPGVSSEVLKHDMAASAACSRDMSTET